MQERPYGATDEAANQTSKPPSFQTSNLPVGREGAGGRRGPSPPDRPHPLRLRGNWGASQASKPPNFQASSPAARVCYNRG